MSLSAHPLFRRGNLVFCLVLAAEISTVLISLSVNPHSAAWLIAFYTTVGLLLLALRGASQSALFRAYALYLSTLALYLSIVWVHHILIPGISPAAAKQQDAAWSFFLRIGTPFIPITLFHFTLAFTQSRSKLLRWIELAGWAGAFAFLISHFSGNFVVDSQWTGRTWVPTMGGDYPSFLYFTTFYLTASIAVPLFALFTAKSRQRRLQLFYYLLGAAPAWIACWTHFLLSLGINLVPMGGLMFLFHAAVLAYAVFKKQVFDFTIVMRRGLAYAGVSLILGMSYGGLIWILPWNTLESQTQLASKVIFASIAGIAYVPLLGYLQKAIDSFFFREESQRQYVLEQLVRETSATVLLDKVAEVFCRFTDRAIRPRRTALYLNDAAGQPVLFAKFEETFFRMQWPDGEHLNHKTHGELAQEFVSHRIQLPQQTSSSGGIKLQEGNEGLVVPIVHGSERLGCLLLEPKMADEPYTEDDIRFVESLAAHSSSALLNARSFARLEHLQELTTQTLQALSAAVILIAADNRILRANAAARTIFNLGDLPFPETLVQLAILKPVVGGAIAKAIAHAQPCSNEALILEGTTPLSVLFSFRILAQTDGDSIYLVLLHDITDYKRRENLARLGESISAINHEIKNLVQPIRYQVDRLAETDPDDAEANKRVLSRSMTVIPDRLAALERLLANMADLARPIELRVRKVDLQDLIQSVWRDLSEMPMAAGIHFELSVPSGECHCPVDAHWMRQVLYNLLRNSSEALAGRATPEIRVATTASATDVEIGIQDNGCGMNEFALRKLFEPFYSTKGGAGTGLGLVISRKIVELHGGKLTVESQENKGTLFKISLPLEIY